MWIGRKGGRIRVTDNAGRLAEVTFLQVAKDTVDCRLIVNESLRGQGIAGELLERAAGRIRREEKRVIPTCSYAVHWFERHREQADLLSKNFKK